MKKTFLYIMLSAILLSLGSCTSNELEVLDTPTDKGTYTVSFKMSNPSKAKSRGYQQLESDINQLYAVVFDGTSVSDLSALANETVKGVYQVTATPNNDENYDCSFTMDQTGDFVVCFVANANTALVNAMKETNLTVTAFKALVASQDPETFLMVSTDFQKFTLDALTATATWGDGNTESTEVTMKRTVARIDIKNSVDGLTIHSIAFANRAIKTGLWNDNRTTTEADYLESEKVYTINTTTHTLNPGSSVTPGTHNAEIYTYEQHNATAYKPSLTFTYALEGVTYTDEDSDGTPDYPNDLTLEFKRTTNGADAYVPLQRNYKYTVNITMVNNKFRFTIEVLDWETGETFELTPENLVAEDTEQRPDQITMNKALKVYDLFTDFNVASIKDNVVIFETSLHNNTDLNKGDVVEESIAHDHYYTYEEAMKLTGLKDAEGNNYRLPTTGELQLLLPIWKRPALEYYNPWWNTNPDTNSGYSMYTGEFSETIYMENAEADVNGYIYYDKEGEAFTGWSQLAYKSGDTYTAVTWGGKQYHTQPVYGYRFRGTGQYAAYCWESKKVDGQESETERYLSIKIKALDNYYDADITVEDIANEDFWASDYIEVMFPASGYYTPVVYDTDGFTYKSGGKLTNRGVNGVCWSSSRSTETTARYLYFSLNGAGVYSNDVGHKFPLRLVKVSQK